MRKITIANAHSQNEPTQTIELEMEGGSPWYAYVWIDDKGYTIYRHGETGKISIEPMST